MIRISVKPKTQGAEALALLGTATITLDVLSPDDQGLPVIEATVKSLRGAIAFKVLTTPHDKYGHIVEAEQHTGATLLHCVQTWNEFQAYVVTVEEGQEFINTEEPDLPEGAIP